MPSSHKLQPRRQTHQLPSDSIAKSHMAQDKPCDHRLPEAGHANMLHDIPYETHLGHATVLERPSFRYIRLHLQILVSTIDI